jgi:hypothetical protein
MPIFQAIEKRFILISFGKINGKLLKGFDGIGIAKLFLVQKNKVIDTSHFH